MEHGVELVREVSQHAADVVQHVAGTSLAGRSEKNYKKFSIRSELQMCPIYVKLTLYHANDELKKSNFRKKVFGIIIITKINSYTNNELKNKIRTFMIFTFQSLSKKAKYPPRQNLNHFKITSEANFD